ncbi:hypothetical protein SERLA73DRAFT_149799 [Serpula lacrymans var. lacrymans S7.3]|uniref:Uncharacterized protein n=1 Tax=Serpula lacrymans var. lacrymans (strain S7.3) TaxID=936435 RepID=F8PK65_SERL3|nr:hypothetical protein SERLA73DRAFT_149799 [Serpula lacrymans var. lacrymans S7.3]
MDVDHMVYWNFSRPYGLLELFQEGWLPHTILAWFLYTMWRYSSLIPLRMYIIWSVGTVPGRMILHNHHGRELFIGSAKTHLQQLKTDNIRSGQDNNTTDEEEVNSDNESKEEQEGSDEDT